MSAASSLGLHPCFTGPDALIPCVIELGVASTSTVSEPRAAATATTAFAGVLHGAAFGTHRIDHSRRRAYWWGLHVNIGQRYKEKEYNHNNYLHMPFALNLRLQASTPSNHL